MAELRIQITPAARKDIRSLRKYSRGHWGATTANEYLDRIITATESLGVFPERGLVAGQSDQSIRRILSGRHVIYYRILEPQSTVEVLRVLHECMDAIGQVE